MKVIIRDTKKEGSLWAAHHIAAAIKAKAEKTDKPFVLGLPTGSTPLDTYAELARMCAAGEISFKNVITFNMDEYVGIPENHPESYHSFMHRNLFDKIDIPAGNIHILNGNAATSTKSARITRRPSWRLAASTCSSAESARTATRLQRAVLLPQLQNKGDDPYPGHDRGQLPLLRSDVNMVPKRAMSVGVATVCSAKEVLVLAFGGKKARVVRTPSRAA